MSGLGSRDSCTPNQGWGGRPPPHLCSWTPAAPIAQAPVGPAGLTEVLGKAHVVPEAEAGGRGGRQRLAAQPGGPAPGAQHASFKESKVAWEQEEVDARLMGRARPQGPSRGWVGRASSGWGVYSVGSRKPGGCVASGSPPHLAPVGTYLPLCPGCGPQGAGGNERGWLPRPSPSCIRPGWARPGGSSRTGQTQNHRNLQDMGG